MALAWPPVTAFLLVGNLARPLLRPLLVRSAPLPVPAKLALGGALLVALSAAGRRTWR